MVLSRQVDGAPSSNSTRSPRTSASSAVQALSIITRGDSRKWSCHAKSTEPQALTQLDLRAPPRPLRFNPFPLLAPIRGQPPSWLGRPVDQLARTGHPRPPYPARWSIPIPWHEGKCAAADHRHFDITVASGEDSQSVTVGLPPHAARRYPRCQKCHSLRDNAEKYVQAGSCGVELWGNCGMTSRQICPATTTPAFLVVLASSCAASLSLALSAPRPRRQKHRGQKILATSRASPCCL